ncbi:F510_1955 family glycosylhydrolase [Microvirga brassicacearum]|uniref:Exo-alpha-sialidase n=1 Tax=Microvirga brassicacearum TaxID=2580413 RepID=A0A5N3PDZ6_9HYPH|nr:exo-alpha-sialidase [Microvirga brassicacearum]KAB0267930.1 exo-alpha-sialidase [Microvirga brassicacearum]
MTIGFSTKLAVAGAVALATLVVGSISRSVAGETVAVSELTRQTHIHGLAVDRQDSSRLFIATHHGLFHAGSDGKAERVSEVQDFMGFNPHPRDARTLYASGHPQRGGNLGFIASTDQGRTWTQISPGVNGPVDFHQMSVSPADPTTIYGVYQGLQLSQDGGRSWKVVGTLPAKLIDLAASARNAETLYAATETGLLRSGDSGRTWTSLIEGAPVTLVEIAPDGALYAYVFGRGLVRSQEETLQFETRGNDIGGGFLLHLAADPTNANRLFAATDRGRILSSADQGRSWASFGG